MYKLTVMAAFEYVRRAMDELVTVEDIGLLQEPDAVDLHRLVEGCIVEAVVKTYSMAPVLLLEGETAVVTDDYTIGDPEDGVVTITMLSPTARVLSIKCCDSDYIVSDFLPENSPEARQQLNKYIRGTYDDPRVVLQKKWNGEHKPIMKYYTTKAEEGATEGATEGKPTFEIEFLPYPVLEEGVVAISPRIEYAVLNNVVAMVLTSLKELELAERFKAKAAEYLEGQ